MPGRAALRFGPVAAVSLIFASCSFSSGSEVLAACGGPFDDLDRDPGSARGAALVFDAEVYAPGDRAGVDWDAKDRDRILTGDEWGIECWNGDAWMDAWLAVGIYFDDPSFVYLEDETGVTDDGFPALPGVIVIPKDAPDGLYRTRQLVDIRKRTEAIGYFEVLSR